MANRGVNIALLVFCLIGLFTAVTLILVHTHLFLHDDETDFDYVDPTEFQIMKAKAAHLYCQCGTPALTVNKSLEEMQFVSIFREMHSSNPDLGVISEVMGTEDCKDCEMVYVTCKFPYGSINCCMKGTFKVRFTERKLPAQVKSNFTIPSEPDSVDGSDGGVQEMINITLGGGREKRQAEGSSCGVPSSMDTASGSCRRYPSSVKCVQRCIFGYAVDGAISKQLQCKFKENKWEPSGFKECEPFVDCTVTLVSPGSSSCSSASLTKAPECRIGCLRYEDKEEVPDDVYTCSIDGKWDPPLPFCAVPKSGLVLVKAPSKKIHDDLLDNADEQLQ